MDQGAISRGGANGPYADSTRQRGFVDWGVSHLMKTFASFELSQKFSWYQKWNVHHLFARPEVGYDPDQNQERPLVSCINRKMSRLGGKVLLNIAHA